MFTKNWSFYFSLIFLKQSQPIMSLIAKDICAQYMSCLIEGGRPIEYAKFCNVGNDNIINNFL